MTGTKRLRRTLVSGLLAGSLGGCGFIESTATNPNAVPSASVDQLFTGIQVNTFFFNESILSRLAAVWTQQMAGTDRQFANYDIYLGITEELGDDPFNGVYTGGGLVDLRKAIAQAEEVDRRVYAGILKIHEAYFVGMAASIWGDLPYSQAVQPEEFPTPVLDPQPSVYAAVQALLDEAILDLASGEGAGPAGFDLNFGGDPTRWTAVAWSLKARFHLHWAELEGSARYTQAHDAALQGISAITGNWRAIHSTAATEANLWHQFQRDRSGYMQAGKLLVDLLDVNGNGQFDAGVDDPRLPLYFTKGTGVDSDIYVGSGVGEFRFTASNLNVPGQANFNQPILTCSETQLIVAEARARLGDEPGARTALAAGLACQEAQWGITLPDVDPALSGTALIREILTQKYIANFLNIEVYNDYKRACWPQVPTYLGQEIPGRLFYSDDERQTNPNIPPPGVSDERGNNGSFNNRAAPNAQNDPSGCLPYS